MAESTRLVDLIQLRIDEFLSEQSGQLATIAEELTELTDIARGFLAGGKRFRALFCYWGWQSAAGVTSGFDPLPTDEASADLDAVVMAATALELFHAAALVHDDIMDNSDTRRGAPAAHRLFERHHIADGWTGNPTAFGESAALLLGDLLTEAKVVDKLQAGVAAGATQVTVTDGLLQSGDRMEVGLGECSELNSVVAVEGQVVTLGTALRAAHSAAEPVTAVVVYEVLGVEDQAGAGHHLKLAVRRQEG